MRRFEAGTERLNEFGDYVDDVTETPTGRYVLHDDAQKRIRELEQEVAGLRDHILMLEGMLEEANRQVAGLECDRERLREEVTELKAKVEHHETVTVWAGG